MNSIRPWKLLFLLIFVVASSTADRKFRYLLSVPRFASFKDGVTGLLSTWNVETRTSITIFVTKSRMAHRAKLGDSSVIGSRDLTLEPTVGNEVKNYLVKFSPTDKQNEFPYLHVFAMNSTTNDLELLNSTSLAEAGEKRKGAEGGALMFIETDKSVFKPGQTVNIRLLKLTDELKPDDSVINKCVVKNPRRFVLRQWLNIKPEGGLKDLKFHLELEPMLGSYTIECVNSKGSKETLSFKVDEYVLPKFESTITVGDSDPSSPDPIARLCGTYTHGGPVAGRAAVKACRGGWNHHGRERRMVLGEMMRPDLVQPNPEVCQEFEGPLEKGCLEAELNTAETRNFMLFGQIIESGTEIRREVKKNVDLSNEFIEFKLVRGFDSYKANVTNEIKIKVTYTNGKPAVDERIQVELASEGDTDDFNVTVDGDGVVGVNLSRPISSSASITLKCTGLTAKSGRFPLTPIAMARFKNVHHLWADRLLLPSGTFFLRAWRSLSGDSLKLKPVELKCGERASVSIEYSSQDSAKDAEEKQATFLILARNGIRRHGTVTLRKEGVVAFDVDPNWSPKVGVVVYVFNGVEIVSDHLLLDLAPCFENVVSLSFNSGDRTAPGAETELTVTPAAPSLCGLSGVDKSVELLEAVERVTVAKVLERYPAKNEMKNSDCREAMEDFFVTDLRTVGDVMVELCEMGMWRGRNRGRMMHKMDDIAQLAFAEMSVDEAAVSAPATRSNFPETWLWKLVNVTGKSAVVAARVPDTITEWRVGAVCLSERAGLGFAKEIGLTASQDFFVRVHFPYEAVRGESLPLKVQTFNYLSACLPVSLRLDVANGVEVLSGANGFEFCVCGGVVTREFRLKATEAGDVEVGVEATTTRDGGVCDGREVAKGRVFADRVERKLSVVVEGFEQELVNSKFICLNDNKREDFSFDLTRDEAHGAMMVPGSIRGAIQVIGDAMGPALGNLDGLVRMPCGCGEQTMITMCPNVYVLKYLAATEQAEPEMRAKARSFALDGYNREVTNYRRRDGSFSAFPTDASGSAWLTGFVLKCFGQARGVVSDLSDVENVLGQGVKWLSERQNENGSYQSVGRVIHTEMKGELGSSEFGRTAFILTGVLESGVLRRSDSINSAVRFLLAHNHTALPTFALVLGGYALALSGDRISAAQMAPWVAERARRRVADAAGIYWRNDDDDRSDDGPVLLRRGRRRDRRNQGVDVETTSYALLWTLTEKERDLGVVVGVVKWLTAQQKAGGGFESTQDTILGLQALAEAATVLYRNNNKDSVSLRWTSEDERGEDSPLVDQSISKENRLVLQRAAVPVVGETLKLSVSMTTKAPSNACVLAQAILRYNTKRSGAPEMKEVKVNATTTKIESDAEANRVGRMEVCLFYGDEDPSGMYIAEANLPTGWKANKGSAWTTMGSPIMMQENRRQDSAIAVYFDELRPNETTCLTFSAHKEFQVPDAMPGKVVAYDYYQPRVQMMTEFVLIDEGSAGVLGVADGPKIFDPTGAANAVSVGWTLGVILLAIAHGVASSMFT